MFESCCCFTKQEISPGLTSVMMVLHFILGVSWIKKYLVPPVLTSWPWSSRQSPPCAVKCLKSRAVGSVCRAAMRGLIPTLFSPFVLGCFPEVQASQFLCSRKRTISLSSFSQAAFSSLLGRACGSAWVGVRAFQAVKSSHCLVLILRVR